MYTERQLELCARIREHCRAQHWYGPQAVNPWLERVQERNRHQWDPATGQAGTRDLWSDSRIEGFAFPPATDAQLTATERELGYPLPAMLRALYSQLANGGFGPGHGLEGIADGYMLERDLYNRPSDIRLDVTYESTQQQLDRFLVDESLFNLADYEARHGLTTRLLLPPKTWPERFLYLADWGCAMRTCMDAHSGRIYFADVFDVVENSPANESDARLEIYLEDYSLEEWLENWMRMERGEPDSSPQKLTKSLNAIPMLNYIPPDSELAN